MHLDFLVNPFGTGVALAFWWFGGVSVVALNITARAFRVHPPRKRLFVEMMHLVGTVSVTALCGLMAFYAPEALERVHSLDDYRRLGLLLVAAGVVAFVVGLIGFTMMIGCAFHGRRHTAWHWPLFWLVLVQVVLMNYVLAAAVARWSAYSELGVNGDLGVESWDPLHSYMLIGSALVLTVVAAGNLVLAREAVRLDYMNEVVQRHLTGQYRWGSILKLHHLTARPTRLRRLGEPLLVLVPFKVFSLRGNMQQHRAQQRKDPAGPNWLDWLVASLAAMNSATLPWNPGDSPDDGDGRRDANRT